MGCVLYSSVYACVSVCVCVRTHTHRHRCYTHHKYIRIMCTHVHHYHHLIFCFLITLPSLSLHSRQPPITLSCSSHPIISFLPPFHHPPITLPSPSSLYRYYPISLPPISLHSLITLPSLSLPSLSFLSLSPAHVDMATVSGMTDSDYPTLVTQVPALANLPYVGDFKHTPLPPELIEHFDRILLPLARVL